MEGIKGERNERQSDRAENHDQNGLYLGRFEVEKVTCLIQNALCLYLELWFLPRQGAHFQKIHEKSGQKMKNGAGRPWMASVMAICGGLVGPKSGNVEKVKIFKAFSEGSTSQIMTKMGFIWAPSRSVRFLI